MGQFVVRGLELPSVYVRTKFDDVGFIRDKEMAHFAPEH